MCSSNYRALSSKKRSSQAATLALLTWLALPAGQALADPIIIRGDENPNVLKASASVNVPQSAPDFQPPAPPAGALNAAAGAAGGMAAGAGAAHFAGAAQQAHQQYQAESGRYNNGRPVTAVRTPEHRTYFQEHPKVRAALLGAGVGTAAGAVTGLITHKGVIRGAAIGAGAGAGVGLIRSSDTLRRHPIVKDLATGAVAGLGLGMASSHHLGGKVGKLTAVGAALGLGVGVLRDKLK